MGRKGAAARAAKLTPKERSAIAKKAVQTRIKRLRESRASGGQ